MAPKSRTPTKTPTKRTPTKAAKTKPKPNEPEPLEVQISVRFPISQIERLDALAPRVGLRITRVQLIRAVIDEGLVVMERRYPELPDSE